MKDDTAAFCVGLLVAGVAGAAGSTAAYNYGRHEVVSEQAAKAKQVQEDFRNREIESMLGKFRWDHDIVRSLDQRVGQIETFIKTKDAVDKDAEANSTDKLEHSPFCKENGLDCVK